jgi:tetratricopeptide (TPR) repeat protein
MSLVAFTLAVFSKPMAVTLPFILFLFDFLARRRLSRASIVEKMPFIAIAIAFVVIEAAVGGSLKTPTPGIGTGVFHRISVASFAMMFYVSKVLVPAKLAILYPYTDQIKGMLPAWFHFAPLTMLAAAFLIVYSIKCTRKVVFGSLFALFAVAPVLQFIPVPGDAIVGDRHTYIMAVGIGYLVAEGLVYLYRRRPRRPARYASALVAAGALVVLFVLTFQRSKVWKDSISVWSDVFSKYRIVAPIAYYNRADAYSAAKQYAKAIGDLKMAVQLNPDYVDAYNNLGIAYTETGVFDAAIAAYDRVLAIRPDFADAYYNRAMAYIRKKDFAAAAGDFSQAISITPGNIKAYMHRGNMYAILKDYTAAIRDYSRVLESQPADAATYCSRANMFAMLGEYDRAIADYTAAIARFPGPGIYVEAYRNRAMTYFSMKAYDKAWDDVNRLTASGISLSPDFLNRLRDASGR